MYIKVYSLNILEKYIPFLYLLYIQVYLSIQLSIILPYFQLYSLITFYIYKYINIFSISTASQISPQQLLVPFFPLQCVASGISCGIHIVVTTWCDALSKLTLKWNKNSNSNNNSKPPIIISRLVINWKFQHVMTCRCDKLLPVNVHYHNLRFIAKTFIRANQLWQEHKVRAASSCVGGAGAW